MAKLIDRYIDLFAGCGGLSLGLYNAGWKGILAVERNPDAFRTLKANLIDRRGHFDWPVWLEKTAWDIKEILNSKRYELTELRGKVGLIVGGPPCQGFSTAGRRHESDKRNNLLHSYLSFVELVKPNVIMFENVLGFTMKFKANADAGINYSEVVIQRLKDLGYHDAQGKIIDMSDYGVPQRRKRFIVIATRANLAKNIFAILRNNRKTFLTAKGIPLNNSVEAALSDLQKCHGTIVCPDTARFQSGRASNASTGLQKYLRKDQKLSFPDSHRFVNHTLDVENVFKKLLAVGVRNRCINGSEREMFGLKKRSVTVLDPNESAPTITTIPDDFIHYSEPRVMTVRECARLQTFPDWFEFKGPYTTGGKMRVQQTPRYTQVGNAVPPLFSELVGISIKEVFCNGS